ncbi:MAG: hybrid sensor histidine kinase/response regulator [Anaerolineae bacterium]|nr:hybrid sensor histidine kinase/response regulator [Anaerolineae bacterium]MCB9106481.1 hybrid sensor histidine kinase/response regulator [Anaerolineales bacterium]
MPTSNAIRILYMEDDAGLARLFKKKLERAGFSIDLAPDGETGLIMAAAARYDVIAVDQNMPVYDGLAIIRRLADRGPLPPTIMITGSGNEQIAIEAMKLGASDYIVKDGDGRYLELLPTVIEQVLVKERLIRERHEAILSLQQVNRNLSLLNRVGQELTASLDLQKIATTLLQAVTETIGAEGSSVWLKTDRPEKGLICQAAYHRSHPTTPIKLHLRPGQGIAGWVSEQGQSVTITSATDDPRFAPEIDRETKCHTESLLAVPISARGTVIGTLEVINKIGGCFNADDRALVETLAASAAIAIDNARLVEALRHQTAELQARNEELDAFAHTVAHDLKTPLGPVIGLADLLARFRATMSEEAVNDSLETIARSSHKMDEIINELLLLATIRDTDIETEMLDMLSLVAEVRQRLAHIFDQKQVQVILPAHWPMAIGYGPWIEEVWANYLSNAIKYGGNPPRVEIGGKRQTNGMVRYWVRDNGDGLTAAEQARLFTPFTQIKRTKAGGHGLGLSIVHRIIEKLGGEVGIESRGIPGLGCTFYFTLPAAPELVSLEPLQEALTVY